MSVEIKDGGIGFLPAITNLKPSPRGGLSFFLPRRSLPLTLPQPSYPRVLNFSFVRVACQRYGVVAGTARIYLKENPMSEELPESVCITPADPIGIVTVYPLPLEGKPLEFDSKEFLNFLNHELRS